MKTIIFLIAVLITTTSQAQLDVRVRKSTSGSEVNVKTNGKSGASNNTGTKTNTSETKTTPVTEAPKAANDTTSKPAGNSSFDADYKGPAKTYVTSFWRQVETFKSGKGTTTIIQNMERAIGTIKDKDPSYNITTMEAEVKTAKDALQKEEDAKKTPEELAKDRKLNTKTSGYSGPASSQVKYFWNYALMDTKDDIAMFNRAMGEMEYAINETKRKDPAYNTAEMEAEFKKRKDADKERKLAEVRATSGDKRSSRPPEKESDDPTTLLEKLFLEASIGVENTMSETSAKIDAYKARAQKLLAMDYTDALVKKGRLAKGNISGFKAISERELGKVDKGTGSMYVYYLIQYHLAFWDAAQKVFPEESSFTDMYKKLNAAAVKMGSPADVAVVAAKEAAEKIRNTRLPAAVVRDATFEKLIIESFDKIYGASRNVKALKSVLTQDGWTTLRNSLTGIILGRERSAKMAYKSADGKCNLLDDYIFIHQEYIGGSFTNTKAVFNGLFGSEMLCENVK